MNFEQYLDNPNVQAFLGMLRDAEGTSKRSNPYKTRFGGQVDESLDYNALPTFVKKEFTQTDGKKNLSGAVGAYQFIQSTWRGLQRNYGFKDFSPKTQDMAAIALLKENGALPHILRGDFNTALKKAGPTWASLPTSPHPQHTRSHEFVQNSLQKHLGQPVDLGKYDELTQHRDTSSPKTTAPTQSTSQVPVAKTQAKKSLWSKIKSIFSRV